MFLIDTMAMAFRTFYGLGRAGLTTRNAEPISAVYGTALFLTKILKEEKPDYWVALTDRKEKTYRHAIYPDYKGHRDAMPDDLAKQLPGFNKLLELFGIKPLSLAGYEADDLIATIATKASQNSLHSYIVSGDKDFLQLINSNIYLYSPKKNEAAQVIDTNGVMTKMGCTPAQVIDCLALMGDSADNVPGVPGIGEKTASKLLLEHKSLDNIYKNIDQIKGKKIKENLEKFREQAFLSKKLVTLNKDVPIDYELKSFLAPTIDTYLTKDLIAFYENYDFTSLIKSTTVAPRNRSTQKKSLLYKVSTEKDLNKISKLIDSSERLAIATVGDGLDPAVSKNVKFFFSTTKDEVYEVDLNDNYFLKKIAEILNHYRHTIIGADLKIQWQRFRNQKVHLHSNFFDILIADYLIDPNSPSKSYQNVAEKYATEHISCPLFEQPQAILHLAEILQDKISSCKLSEIFYDIEMPLLPILAKMEQAGVHLDDKELAKLSAELAKTESSLKEDIEDLAGEKFNINSTKQLQNILYEKIKIHEVLKVKSLKKTKTGLSTDESVLRKLIAHPIARKILNYREVTKIKSTYVDTLPQYISPVTGRLHGNFRQNGTATGRLSSDSPNLQNIPMHSIYGKHIRQAFTPQTGDWVMISADYSQIEIRLLAAFSGALPLIDAFKGGLDIHKATAAKIFSLNEDDITPDIRSKAKAVNFGILYGMGPQRLSSETGTTLKEAKEFIAKYYDTFPEIYNYIDNLKKAAKEKGYSQTAFGRRRPIHGLDDSNKAVQARAFNIAVNAPIQGSAADLIKVAMINIQQELDERHLQARLILQIHDELVLECPREESCSVQELVKRQMTTAMQLAVPLLVSIKEGKNWFEAH